MDFEQAILAHSTWKVKLSAYAQKPDRSLKPGEIALDNRCDLGKWIYGEGAKFTNLPDYNTLKAEHARFHRCASEIVRRADAGENVAGLVAVGAKSEFMLASVAVVNAIIAMRSKAKA